MPLKLYEVVREEVEFRMDLLQLQYFRIVARMEHMTRAAEYLQIAQPSLSKTISRLEGSLGVPLFDRQGKQIRLNRFGQAFLKRVERIYAELDEAHRELKDMAGLEHGVVHLVATTTHLLPNFIAAFVETHPHVGIQLQQVSSNDVSGYLEDGQIDFCISSPPVEQPGIQCHILMVEDIYLAVPAHHRFAHRGEIQLGEVADDRFISLTSDYILRDVNVAFCQQAGFSPNIAFECNDASVIFDMVKLGLGIAFVPAHWWQGGSGVPPVKLSIANPACQRTIGMSWAESRYMSAAARTLRTFACEYFANR